VRLLALARVRGWSMYPLLRHGQWVVVEGITYRFRPPRRGDVVMACLGGREVLKLLAALPGDRVAVDGGRVWVNGAPLELTGAQGEGPPGEPLPPHHYFLLSLAADVGVDSRQQGTVGQDGLLGRACLVLWPPRLLL